jgi:HEAT repeat protein
MHGAAHALAAMGAPAVVALIDLLHDDSEWTRVNAAFALGEMDSNASAAVPALMRCLSDDSDRVVRTAVDALGHMGRTASAAVPAVAGVLRDPRPQWDRLSSNRPWTVGEMVRTNAAMALTRLCVHDDSAESDLIEALDNPCEHVGIFAMQGLCRLGSRRADEAVMNYLSAKRWDSSINAQRPF